MLKAEINIVTARIPKWADKQLDIYLCLYADFRSNGEWLTDDSCYSNIKPVFERMEALLKDDEVLGVVIIRIKLSGLPRDIDSSKDEIE